MSNHINTIPTVKLIWRRTCSLKDIVSGSAVGFNSIKIILLTTILALNLNGSLNAQTQITVAVIPFEGKGVSSQEASALSDRLAVELFLTGSLRVLERGKMDEILLEQDFQLSGCATDECLVEVGQILGVEQIITGSISKIGNTFSVVAQLISVETSELQKVAIFDTEGSIDGVLKEGMRAIAQSLTTSTSDQIKIPASRETAPLGLRNRKFLDFFTSKNPSKYKIGVALEIIDPTVSWDFGSVINPTPFFVYTGESGIGYEVLVAFGEKKIGLYETGGYAYNAEAIGEGITNANTSILIRLSPQFLVHYNFNYGGFFNPHVSIGACSYSFSSYTTVQSTRSDLQNEPSNDHKSNSIRPIVGIGIDLFGNHKFHVSAGIKYVTGKEERPTIIAYNDSWEPKYVEETFDLNYIDLTIKLVYTFNRP